MRVRLATKGDRLEFLGRWREMLQENYRIGGEIIPSDVNVERYGDLFDVYVSGMAEGVVVVAEDEGEIVAVLMWGFGGEPFETRFSKFAVGWGTYVAPSHRRRGLSDRVRDYGEERLKQLGFKTVLGQAVDSNEAGLASGLAPRGRFKRHGVVGVIHLEEPR